MRFWYFYHGKNRFKSLPKKSNLLIVNWSRKKFFSVAIIFHRRCNLSIWQLKSFIPSTHWSKLQIFISLDRFSESNFIYLILDSWALWILRLMSPRSSSWDISLSSSWPIILAVISRAINCRSNQVLFFCLHCLIDHRGLKHLFNKFIYTRNDFFLFTLLLLILINCVFVLIKILMYCFKRHILINFLLTFLFNDHVHMSRSYSHQAVRLRDLLLSKRIRVLLQLEYLFLELDYLSF